MCLGYYISTPHTRLLYYFSTLFLLSFIKTKTPASVWFPLFWFLRLCMIPDEDYGSEKKTKQSDSASSGDSDFKAEIRTASSLSNNEHDRSWEESSDRAPHQDNNIFKYPNDYTETNFPPKPVRTAASIHNTTPRIFFIPSSGTLSLSLSSHSLTLSVKLFS